METSATSKKNGLFPASSKESLLIRALDFHPEKDHRAQSPLILSIYGYKHLRKRTDMSGSWLSESDSTLLHS